MGRHTATAMEGALGAEDATDVPGTEDLRQTL